MMKKIVIVLSTFTVINSYDSYKNLLDKDFEKKNDMNKYEDDNVILYRSELYKSHIFGKKKSDKSYVAYMPTSAGSVRILEKDGHKYTFREECATKTTTLGINTAAFERYVETSFNDAELTFETGQMQINPTDVFSLGEK